MAIANRLKKSGAFWLGILAIVLVITTLASGLKHFVLSKTATDGATGLLLPKLGSQLDSLASVTVKRGSAVVRLQKQGDDWVVADKGGFPAETANLRSLLLSLANMRKLEEKTSDPNNYIQLQVEDQRAEDAKADGKAVAGSTQITLNNDRGDVVADLLVGKIQTQGAAAGHAYSFVRLVNTPQVWLVDGAASLPADSSFWLRASVINLPVEAVKTLEIQHPNGNKPIIGRDQPDQEFRLLNQPAETELLSKKSLPGLAANLAFMELDDVAEVATRPLVGVDKQSLGQSSFTSFAGLVITAQWSTIASEAGWVKFSASTTADADPASRQIADTINNELGRWLVKLPGFKYDLLTKRLESLVVKSVAP
jgi:hypothetical protein